MKNFGLLVSMMLVSGVAMAQETVTSSLDLTTTFLSFTALVASIPVIVELIKKVVKLEGLAAQIVSWTVGVALAFVGYGSQLGIFADTSIVTTIAFGIGASLAANGVFDTGLIAQILAAIGISAKEKSA